MEEAYREVRRLQTLLYRTLGIIRHLTGGDEELTRAISLMQRAISFANQLRLAIIALQAASGPVGWGLALVGIAASSLSLQDFLYDVTRVG